MPAVAELESTVMSAHEGHNAPTVAKLPWQKLLVKHNYPPYRKTRFVSDPSPDARMNVDLAPGDPNLKGHPDINTRVYHESYKPMLVDDTVLPDGRHIYHPFPKGSLSSVYTPLRDWMAYAQPEAFAKLKSNIVRLGSEAPYRVMADPGLHLIMALENERMKRFWLRYGKEAFKKDLGVDPKGIWLPETAIDNSLPQLMHEEGYEYTVLRDDQLEQRGERTNPVGIPVRDKKGREGRFGVVMFSKDLSGPYSYQDYVTHNADNFLEAAKFSGTHFEVIVDGLDAEGKPKLIVVATDGELYGHHKEGRDKFAHHLLQTDTLNAHQYEAFDLQQALSILQRQDISSEQAFLRSPSSWSCEHGVNRWTGYCECGVERIVEEGRDLGPHWEDMHTKQEMYHQTNQLDAAIIEMLDQQIPGWEDSFIPITLETRRSMHFDGDIYQDLADLSKQPEFKFLADSSKRDLYLAWCALQVGKTSCRLFFEGKDGLERKLGWHNLNESRILLERASSQGNWSRGIAA